MKKYLYIITFLIALCGFSQEPSFIHLTEKDGLPDIEFYDILVDDENFVWLAADKGLFRYDGKTFKSYTHPQQRGLSIFNLVKDNSGRLWCKNILGQIFYIENDRLELFIDLKDELKGYIFNLNFLGDELIIITNNKILKINVKTKQKQYVNHQGQFAIGANVIFNNEVYALKHESVFSYAVNGLKRKTNKIKDFTAVVFTYRFFTYLNNLYLLIIENYKNTLYYIDTQRGTVINIKLPNELINTQLILANEIENKLWFATSKGAFEVDIVNQSLQINNVYLKENVVTNCVLDKNNNYWFTTINDGVFVMPNFFIKQYSLPKEATSITSIDKISDNELVFGTLNGVVGWYNIEKQQTQLFRKNFSAKLKIKHLPKQNKTLFSLSEKRLGYILDKNNYAPTEEIIGVKDFALVNDTTFIITSYRNASIVNIEREGKLNAKELPYVNRAYACFYDSIYNNYYVSYANKFVRYDSQLNQHTISLQNKTILALDIDQTNDGVIWLATFNDGLLGIKNDTIYKRYTKNNGLTSNAVTKLLADGLNLWGVTDQGLHKVNTQSNTIETLTKQDGITTYNITDLLLIKDKIVLGSNEGIFEIDKNKAINKKPAPQMYIKSVTVLNKEKPLSTNYQLDYKENTLRFDFHTNTLKTNENIVYEYKLKGGNDTWTTLNRGLDFIEFIGLPSNEYNLQVRAKNYYTNALSSTKSISFNIAKPLWQKGYFWVIVFTLLFLLTYLYFKNISKKRKKEQQLQLHQLQLENKLNNLKLENLRSQMNPHFIFNALNSIQEYIILNQKNLASDYLGKFSDLVRSYLKHSSQEKVSLQEEIECLEVYLQLEQMRFEEKFTYKIKVDPNLETDQIYIPTMLIQPYVENAIKHGLLHKKENCFLSISFSLGNKETKNIICVVQDNGIGRQKAKEIQLKRRKNHQSFATQANKDRLELLNNNKSEAIGVVIKDLFDAQKNPVGTKVTIKTPYYNTL